MALVIKKASRDEVRLRMAISGATKCGKTFTMLRLLQAIAPGKYGVIDSEHGRSKLYVRDSNPDGGVFEEFMLIELDGDNRPETYMEALKMLEDAGCEAIGIDSSSHEWKAILEYVDQRKAAGDKNVQPWAKATPLHDNFLDAILKSKAHIVCTMRSKMEYALEANDKGKIEVKKMGLKPVQREDSEYEFDVLLDMNEQHFGRITGARAQVFDGMVIEKPGAPLARQLLDWLKNGTRSIGDSIKSECSIFRFKALELAQQVEQKLQERQDPTYAGYAAKAQEFLSAVTDDAAGLDKIKRTVGVFASKLEELTRATVK